MDVRLHARAAHQAGVGLMPTTAFHVRASESKRSPSCPMASVAKFALRHAAEPPDEPPTVRSGSYGLRVAPNIEP